MKVSKVLLISFFIIIAIHAEEVESDDEIIKNLEFLQYMEMMESEVDFDEIENLNTVDSVGLLEE